MTRRRSEREGEKVRETRPPPVAHNGGLTKMDRTAELVAFFDFSDVSIRGCNQEAHSLHSFAVVHPGKVVTVTERIAAAKHVALVRFSSSDAPSIHPSFVN